MTRSLSWPRVLVEGVVIVGSILLALAADAWWDGTQEQEEEQEILAGLDQEFSRYRATLAASVERHKQMEASFARQLAWTTEIPYAISETEADSALFNVLFVPTFNPGRGVREALVSSGRLELIGSSDLRTALASWQTTVDEVREGELTGREFVLSTVVPYLAEQDVGVGRAYALFPGWWPDEVEPPSFSAPGYLALLDDGEFSNLLAVRYAWLSYVGGAYATALREVDEILAMVRRDIAG